ncbi:ankyrin repeat domain-containing protein [Mucilaginibacter sp. KACC 22063]|uniref:ankyrin repeat domain-containing protein n=1 Tax=Mucilaginibacter sp. KACC 22063 TaxID=3025666 RepID=UPI002365704A|nr:ankyrin repeat domain-containing protein [Mucilaginibacter sp. KACC 22063]WDF56624.1 ankyrin repeat domain-containing protein [Mucilaginibacter sp. KACC 22063]
MSVEQLEAYIGSADIMGLKRLFTANPSLATANTSYNVSPLMLACYFKKPQIVSLILEHLSEINLFEASAAGKFDAVAYLVQSQPDSINDYAPDGFTPLGLACYFGHLEVAKYLILKGADVNLPADNNFRVAPIHSAVAGNFTAITKLLIENGANVNVVQQAGSTPLHAAAQNGNLDILILLLENGASVDARMEGGKLPADLAREKGFKEIADILS